LKTHLLRAVRIVVSVGLLAWVISRVPIGELASELAGAKTRWILAAFAVNSVGIAFGAFRWQLLLRSQGRRIGAPFLYGSYVVGLFFNNFLPSTIGGDVIRAASAKRRGGGTLTENLTVVLVERMIGLLATLSLGGAVALSGVASSLDSRVPWVLGGALFLAAAGLYLALSNPVRRGALRGVGRVPFQFVRRTLGKMLVAFELFSRDHGVLWANYFLSLAFQFFLIVHFWLIQFAFGEAVPFATFVVVVPLVFCVMILPIGINGLGVRESAFVWFLTRAGMEPAIALALSLASYVIAVGQGVIGGGVHLWREARGRDSGALAEAEALEAPAEP
jgi:uncharacterized membrane protein YbhN (UPF0104 family)